MDDNRVDLNELRGQKYSGPDLCSGKNVEISGTYPTIVTVKHPFI